MTGLECLSEGYILLLAWLLLWVFICVTKKHILITGVYLFTGCYHISGGIYQCNGVSGNISDHNVLCVSVFVFEIRVYDKLIPA